jgi:hypothetical protein
MLLSVVSCETLGDIESEKIAAINCEFDNLEIKTNNEKQVECFDKAEIKTYVTTITHGQ